MLEDQKPFHQEITEETAQKLISLVSQAKGLPQKPVEQFQRLRNSQIVMGILGTSGLVLFALGVEKWSSTVDFLSASIVDIGVGLLLLSISGLMLKKLS